MGHIWDDYSKPQTQWSFQTLLGFWFYFHFVSISLSPIDQQPKCLQTIRFLFFRRESCWSSGWLVITSRIEKHVKTQHVTRSPWFFGVFCRGWTLTQWLIGDYDDKPWNTEPGDFHQDDSCFIWVLGVGHCCQTILTWRRDQRSDVYWVAKIEVDMLMLQYST